MFRTWIHGYRTGWAACICLTLLLYVLGPMTEIAAAVSHDFYHLLHGESSNHALDHRHVHGQPAADADSFHDTVSAPVAQHVCTKEGTSSPSAARSQASSCGADTPAARIIAMTQSTVARSHDHGRALDTLLSAATGGETHQAGALTTSHAWDHILPHGEIVLSFSATHRTERPALRNEFLEDHRWERPPRLSA